MKITRLQMLILLLFALATHTLPAQHIKQKDLIGTWEMVSDNGQMPKDILLLHFSENGEFKSSITSVEFNITEITLQGSWKLEAKARILTLLPTDKEKIDLYVLELNKEKISLTLYGETTGEKRVVTFKKTNKKIEPTPKVKELDEEKIKQDVKEDVLSLEILHDIIKAIPSPLELSFLLNGLGVKYEKSTLNYIDTVGRQDADFRNALFLGAYQTAFGQASIYEKTPDVLAHLDAIQKIADRLQAGKYMDAEVIKKVAKTNNLDSLLTVASGYFNVLNDFFLGENRKEISFLILTGSWIENMYLLCNVYQRQPSEILKNRMGEQKLILEQLILLLSFSAKEPFIQNLITDLKKLEKLYEEVKLTYHSTSTGVHSETTFNEKTFQVIRQSISEMRSKWIH